MRGKDDAETGLSPDQQFLLMGKVEALEEALHCVALGLPEPARKFLRDVARIERDNQEATARVPPPYRAAFSMARFHVFDRLITALAEPPHNDNQI